MIITKLFGGLGNQLFQYAIGRALAEKNQDNLHIDNIWYNHSDQRQYELNSFPIRATPIDDQALDILFKDTRFIRRLLRLTQWKIIREKTLQFDPSILDLHGNLYLDGYWDNSKYFETIRHTLLRELVPKNHSILHKTRFASKILNSNSVSLHVRRGDYVNDQKTRSHHGILPIDFYKNAVKFINSKIPNPEYYIFSDDPQWVKNNLDFIQHKYVISNNLAVSDLYYMTICRHHIIANSTFSWWGSWLSNYKNQITISPKIWFSGQSDVNPSLENWIKI